MATLQNDGFVGFEPCRIPTPSGAIFVMRGGLGSPVLLLHGFPDTHLMWRRVATVLARDHVVVAADLPGYGQSACPTDADDVGTMSKRALATSLIAAMRRIGHDRFAVVGHDRGGRVAYRMALDHPDVVTSLAVLDVIPTGALWERADARLMLAFWPFSLLAQPAPLPERLVGACPEAVVDDALARWGSPAATFPPEVRAAYVDALRDHRTIRAICQEYRAAASFDRDHDEADSRMGRRIGCPVLALWSEVGGLNSWYRSDGGPLAIRRSLADFVAEVD